MYQLKGIRSKMSKRSHRPVVVAILLAFASQLAFNVSGMEIVSEGASELNGSYSEKNIDMEIKVLGGSMKLVRAYRDGEWVWNPAFGLPRERDIFGTDFNVSGTTTEIGCGAGCHGSNISGNFISGVGGGLNGTGLVFSERRIRVGRVLERNGDFFRHNNVTSQDQDDGSVLKTETFVNASGTAFLTRVIRENGTDLELQSAAWRDLSGNFMNYDSIGATDWGNRYGVVNTIQRDAQGRVQKIVDHYDREVFTFVYDGESESPSSVEDLAGRIVNYFYNEEGSLERVEDVRGKSWLYDDTTDFVRTDPDGRIVTVKLNSEGVVREISRGGAVTKYSFRFSSTTDLPSIVTTTSPAGVVETKQFDEKNRLARHVIDGVTVLLVQQDEKDDGTSIETETDETGYTVERVRDVRGNIVKVNYPDDSTETYGYDLRFNFTKSYTNRNGVTETYEYDSNGNFNKLTEAVGTDVERTTLYEYDEFGRLKKTTWVGDQDTETSTNEWTYDAYGNITSFIDGELVAKLYQVHNELGDVLEMRDGNNKLWQFEYDAAGNQTLVRDPLGRETQFVYDGSGNILAASSPDSSSITFKYDAQSRLRSTVDPDGNESSFAYQDATQIYELTDALGNTSLIENDAFGQRLVETGATGLTTLYSYQGRQLRTIFYPTYTQQLRYDQNKRLISSQRLISGTDKGTENLTYDNQGNVTSITNEEGQKTEFYYDALGRLVRIVESDLIESRFAYDNRENIILFTDGENRQVAYEVDRNDRVTAEIAGVSPDLGRREFGYDQNGQIETLVTPNGELTRFLYNDAGDHLTTEIYASASSQTPAKVVTYNRNLIGQLSGYDDGVTSATYVYDDNERLLQATVDFGPFSKSYSYTYYENGWIKSYTNPESVTHEYDYFPDGKLASVSIPGEGRLTYANYKWLAPESATLPGNLELDLSFNGLLQLENYVLRDAAGQPITSIAVEYDLIGNITLVDDDNRVRVFGYDNVSQLTSETITQSGGSNVYSELFTYDKASNRLSTSNEDTWIFNERNQLIQKGDFLYEYDANGNLVRSFDSSTPDPTSETLYTYDEVERLVAIEVDGVEVESYYYDPFGMRLAKTTQGVSTYFLYTSSGLAAEYDSSGNLIAEYHYAPGGQWMNDVLWQKRGGSYYYYVNDQLGTPQKMVSKNGQVAWSADYTAFGELVETVATVPNPLRFAGQYEDSATGLYYNTQRTYDPALGRYLQSDPIGIAGGGNLYSYALQNPLRNVDPEGLLIAQFVGGLAGGACAILNGGSGCDVLGGIIGGATLNPLASAGVSATISAICEVLKCGLTGGNPLLQAGKSLAGSLVTAGSSIGAEQSRRGARRLDTARKVRGSTVGTHQSRRRTSKSLIRSGNPNVFKGAAKGGAFSCFVSSSFSVIADAATQE